MGLSSSSLYNLQKNIGYHFRNEVILTEALTHDSCRVDDPNIKTYQRLEHLGDAVINFAITNYLFRKYPDSSEGTLSTLRANLVNQTKQKEISDQLELHNFVKMHQSVKGLPRHDKFLESVIGAVFIDAGGERKGGYKEAKKVIYNLWELKDGQAAEGNGSIFEIVIGSVLIVGIAMLFLDRGVKK
ncbi:ribonuclease 3 [Folsomia candida]|uniref:Ribonuclease 3 n=1 Tax=Folsomia candida TaxID=158441 RepID=A0A226EY34_FOLCA|nr:ribonuclease 3 [Folsomia candida]OXA62088.1 Ribonuclease 3 [Folsomia candida]